MVTISARRELVRFVTSRGHSQRRACALAGLRRSTCRYKRRGPDRTALVTKLRKLAAERLRFGYRRLHVLLRRAGEKVNRKLVYRLYRSEGLAVRRRGRRKLRSPRPEPLAVATRPNERWAMDFVHDYLADRRPVRMLNIVDTFTRECLAIEVDTSLRSSRVIAVLHRLVAKYGKPDAIRVDNGPEFISRALDAWCFERDVKLLLIQPGKPVQNTHVESFSGRFRDECLGEAHWPTLARARAEIELWRRDYNTKRPHSALAYETPAAFGARARRGLPPSAGAAAALIASTHRGSVAEQVNVN